MKITTFLLTINLLYVSASTFSQGETVSLNLPKSTAKEVFAAIENQTSYKFLYRDIDITDIKVDLNVQKVSVSSVLDKTLKNSSTSYKMLDNGLIVVATKTELYQQPSVTGKVTDALNGEPMVGVNVILEGTTTGVITDINGNYTISAPDLSQATLLFSFIGYNTEKVQVGGQTKIDITLVSDIQNLEEIVVIGYGTQKKVNLTGSVGNVQMDDMESRPLTDASLALQGTVAGVYALQESGKPGDDNTVIDIRGVGTWTNNAPLVLIDGVSGNFSDVNANDIKSISVLKDAASASIYGNRAANGVVLITTKRGTSGKMSVNYNGYFGVQEATRLPSTLNSVEYTTLRNEASINAGGNILYTDDEIQKYAAHNDPLYPDMDYFDVYYGKANTQNHRLSITGGNENIAYAFMLGRLNQDGILVGTNYEKTDFRSNIDAYLFNDKKLRISTKIAGNQGIKGEPTSVWNAKWYATLAPIYPLTNADGEYLTVNGERNPYASILAGTTNKIKRYNFSGQVEAEYQIVKGLSAQLTYGYNTTVSNENAYNANIVLYNIDGSTKTQPSDLTVKNETDIQTMLTTLLKYEKTVGKHNLNLLAGYSEEEFTYDWEKGFRKNFVNNTQRVLSLGDASTQTNDAGSYDLGLRSYFGRLNYIFDEKYLFEANIRRDASSRFAEGHQWGAFPSFSGGWIMSKEDFMKNLGWLNFLKLRASWGQLGNENIGSSTKTQLYYNGSNILSSGQNYSLGGTLNSGVAITALTNNKLTWETAQQLDIGVDMTLNQNFDLTVDYFNKKTKDLLWAQSIPLTMALEAPFVNNGEVENKGIEASLTYRKTFSNGLKLRTTFNATRIVNKITKMEPEEISSPMAKKVGYAIYSFYGYEMDGVYQISDFDYDGTTYTLKPGVVSVSNYIAQPGDLKYKDLNGDGIVDMDNDRKVIGKRYPDLSYSLNINLEWKGFDFSMFFQGVQGIEGYFYYEIAAPFSGVANLGSWWKDRWTPTNPSNTVPAVTLDETKTNVHSSYYMEDASYLRLKNIELGYTLSPKIISKVGISSLRIYGNIQNALTFTKFKGFDPEQKVDQSRAESFPQVRVMTMGLNVNF